ncbi:MAG: ABC transporter ATP-binding protein, partial [Rhodospirillaceae bacterium]|nr:ABC transporter ATP-binding protein [Rhodospirillaceae bacterium]
LMTAGLLEATEGKVVIGGSEVTGPQTDVGVMFQDNTLVPWRTVRGNIELQLEMRRMSPQDNKNKIDQLLASVHMEDFADRHPYELSGGMQQRAAFCQAMIHEPKTMLLDEPLGKLDAMTRERIRSDLQKLWMQKRPTVIFVTHSIEEAIQLSTRVAVITPRPGQIERIIDIDLPFPRDFEVKNSPEFTAYVRETQEIFRGYGVI